MSEQCEKETWNQPDEVPSSTNNQGDVFKNAQRTISGVLQISSQQPYSLFNGLAGSVWFCSDLLKVVASTESEQQAEALKSIYFPSCDLA